MFSTLLKYAFILLTFNYLYILKSINKSIYYIQLLIGTYVPISNCKCEYTRDGMTKTVHSFTRKANRLLAKTTPDSTREPFQIRNSADRLFTLHSTLLLETDRSRDLTFKRKETERLTINFFFSFYDKLALQIGHTVSTSLIITQYT